MIWYAIILYYNIWYMIGSDMLWYVTICYVMLCYVMDKPNWYVMVRYIKLYYDLQRKQLFVDNQLLVARYDVDLQRKQLAHEQSTTHSSLWWLLAAQSIACIADVSACHTINSLHSWSQEPHRQQCRSHTRTYCVGCRCVLCVRFAHAVALIVQHNQPAKIAMQSSYKDLSYWGMSAKFSIRVAPRSVSCHRSHCATTQSTCLLHRYHRSTQCYCSCCRRLATWSTAHRQLTAHCSLWWLADNQLCVSLMSM